MIPEGNPNKLPPKIAGKKTRTQQDLKAKKARTGRTEFRSLATIVTVAILAQGTSWAVAVTQAFLLPGSILGKRALCLMVPWTSGRWRSAVPLSVLSWPTSATKGQATHVPAHVGSETVTPE